jgi:hypothetical protein
MSEDPQRQQLFEYAALGREIDDFWHSKIGRYLLLRCEQEYVTGLSSLAECEASDTDKILRLQSDVRRAKSFKEWLTEAIQTGLMAEQELEGRNDEVPE